MSLIYLAGVVALALWVLWAELQRMPRPVDQWSRYRGVMRLREEQRREPTINTAELTLSLKRRQPRPAPTSTPPAGRRISE